jgi:hypothetical protein
MLDVDRRQKTIRPTHWPAALRLESMTVAAPAADQCPGLDECCQTGGRERRDGVQSSHPRRWVMVLADVATLADGDADQHRSQE